MKKLKSDDGIRLMDYSDASSTSQQQQQQQIIFGTPQQNPHQQSHQQTHQQQSHQQQSHQQQQQQQPQFQYPQHPLSHFSQSANNLLGCFSANHPSSTPPLLSTLLKKPFIILPILYFIVFI